MADCASIGGNHFIHAARRNIGLTAVVFNNKNYGMDRRPVFPNHALWTRIQKPRSTATSNRTLTSARWHRLQAHPMWARSTTYHVRELITQLTNAVRHPGFSVVEAHVRLSDTLWPASTNRGTPRRHDAPVEGSLRHAAAGPRK